MMETKLYRDNIVRLPKDNYYQQNLDNFYSTYGHIADYLLVFRVTHLLPNGNYDVEINLLNTGGYFTFLGDASNVDLRYAEVLMEDDTYPNIVEYLKKENKFTGEED